MMVKSVRVFSNGECIAELSESPGSRIEGTGPRHAWVDPRGSTWSPEAQARLTEIASGDTTGYARIDGVEYDDLTIAVEV